MSTRTRRWVLGVGGAAAATLMGAVVLAAVGLQSLVPASNEIPGWAALQADKLASNPGELWKIYDGGDGPWKQAGVTSAFERYYKNATTKRVLTLIIHRLGDANAAKALYGSKNGAIAGQNGYQTVQVTKQGALATPSAGVTAHLWNKSYYVTLTINGSSAAEVSAAKAFLSSVSTKITNSG